MASGLGIAKKGWRIMYLRSKLESKKPHRSGGFTGMERSAGVGVERGGDGNGERRKEEMSHPPVEREQ